MKKSVRWAVFAVVAASWLLVFYCYPRLPDTIPVHWDMSGQVDGWGSKTWAAFLFPGLITFAAFLALVLPAISPQGFRLDDSRQALMKLIFWIVAYLLVVQFVTCQASLHPNVAVVKWMLVATGGLLMAVGNLLTKFPRNFFVGVRTPWTLTDDRVWDKTHRLARTTFLLAGLLLVVVGLSRWQAGPWLLLAGVLALLIPVVYSYLLYHRLHAGAE